MESKYLPEASYKLNDEFITLDDVQNRISSLQAITCKLIRLNIHTMNFEVKISSSNLCGLIPIKEMSIYQVLTKKKQSVSEHILSLIGKTIRAIPTSINNKNVILSRKLHMEQAFNELKSYDSFENCNITSFYKESTFVDVGAGLRGKIQKKDLVIIPSDFLDFEKSKNISFNIGDIISLNPIYIDKKRIFYLSRINTLPQCIFHKNDVVYAKVISSYGSNAKYPLYTVLINQSLTAILRTDTEIILKQGDCIAAQISKTSGKIKLKFLYNLQR